MDENIFTGITIGPIVSTLMLAKTPAMMWYASYMFSRLTAGICREINSNIPDAVILCPYYSAETDILDGVGRYHDRIIVKTGDSEGIGECIDNARRDIIGCILTDLGSDECKSFLESFFCIHYISESVPQGENPILVLGRKLDALEKMPGFNVSVEKHPIYELFSGDENSRNEYIKSSVFLKELTASSQLLSSGGRRFRSINEICGILDNDGNMCEHKHRRYYVVVQADVDGMGSYLQRPDVVSDLTVFSKKCIDYTSGASEMIGKFGGMTIYAGGDDLLFIAPISSGEKTVFDLISDITDFFKSDKAFGDSSGLTVSFGMSVRYTRFPLYEAFGAARNALFSDAKGVFRDKNSMVLDFQKHSGQCGKICVPMEKLGLFKRIFGIYINNSEDAERTAKSVIYVLDSLSPLLSVEDEHVVENVFNNACDNPDQKYSSDFFTKIGNLYMEYVSEKSDRNIIELNYKDEPNAKPKTFEFMMRLAKFMAEKGGEENE